MTALGLVAPSAGAPAPFALGRRARRLSEIVRRDSAAPARRGPAVFTPTLVAALPEPARRWLVHAIDPGTALATLVELRSHGRIRLGTRWHDYTASQLLAPDVGFVWAARTHLGPVPVAGYDALVRAQGSMRWCAAGVPVERAAGAEVTDSAAERLAADCVLLPTSLVDAAWRPGPDVDSATFRRQVAAGPAGPPVTVRVDLDGRLTEVSLLRRGRPRGGTCGRHLFRVRLDGEIAADGLRIPRGHHAAWGMAPEDEFLHTSVDGVTIAGGAESWAHSARATSS